MLREWEIEKRLSNDSGRTQRKSIRLSDRYEAPTNAKRILLVDDSADTGASLAVAQELLVCLYPNSEIRIAVINAFSRAQESLRIDWLLHSSRLLCLPSSKDHSEYSKFMDLYELDDSK